ncbi:MAG: DUF1289 domain-containing protein [Propionivibrio sp.]
MNAPSPPSSLSAAAAASSIVSPCVNQCRLDAGLTYCLGCLRTRAEIAAWSTASDAERRAILAALAGRREAAR